MSSSSVQTRAQFPSAFKELFEPHRYKVYYGGRGGAKSWAFARALLIMGAQRPLRVLCAREFQKSIAESVHQLLSDQVKALGLESVYEVQKAQIIGPNGTLFVFAGIRHNINNTKSFEGFDVFWVEEAVNVSKQSWKVLTPTLRKEGSEIWISFNPELDSDETYKRFVLHPPSDAVVRKVTWRDNPWFPDVLAKERDDLKAQDEDAYLNVWEGHCLVALDGAVYAKELRGATAENRVTSVPWSAEIPVHTVWDLGHADSTAIWFMQIVGFEYRIIDFYQAHGEKLAHYLKVVQSKPYTYAETWLPHDAEHQLLGQPLTIAQQMRAAGFRPRIVPKLPVAQGIEMARTIFSKCWFDGEKCADGLQSLRHYRYELKPDGVSFRREPLHDWSSHAADAFRYLAIAIKDKPKFVSPSTADSDYNPLDGVPTPRTRYGRTEEHTEWDPLR